MFLRDETAHNAPPSVTKPAERPEDRVKHISGRKPEQNKAAAVMAMAAPRTAFTRVTPSAPWCLKTNDCANICRLNRDPKKNRRKTNCSPEIPLAVIGFVISIFLLGTVYNN